jgi:hypothetical protein
MNSFCSGGAFGYGGVAAQIPFVNLGVDFTFIAGADSQQGEAYGGLVGVTFGPVAVGVEVTHSLTTGQTEIGPNGLAGTSFLNQAGKEVGETGGFASYNHGQVTIGVCAGFAGGWRGGVRFTGPAGRLLVCDLAFARSSPRCRWSLCDGIRAIREANRWAHAQRQQAISAGDVALAALHVLHGDLVRELWSLGLAWPSVRDHLRIWADRRQGRWLRPPFEGAGLRPAQLGHEVQGAREFCGGEVRR